MEEMVQEEMEDRRVLEEVVLRRQGGLDMEDQERQDIKLEVEQDITEEEMDTINLPEVALDILGELPTDQRLQEMHLCHLPRVEPKRTIVEMVMQE